VSFSADPNQEIRIAGGTLDAVLDRPLDGGGQRPLAGPALLTRVHTAASITVPTTLSPSPPTAADIIALLQQVGRATGKTGCIARVDGSGAQRFSLEHPLEQNRQNRTEYTAPGQIRARLMPTQSPGRFRTPRCSLRTHGCGVSRQALKSQWSIACKGSRAMPCSRGRGGHGKGTAMSFGIYLVGFLILIGGLVYGAVLLHLAMHWIVVGAIVLLGLAILKGVQATRGKDPSQ